jgi:hypothetical protein
MRHLIRRRFPCYESDLLLMQEEDKWMSLCRLLAGYSSVCSETTVMIQHIERIT